MTGRAGEVRVSASLFRQEKTAHLLVRVSPLDGARAGVCLLAALRLTWPDRLDPWFLWLLPIVGVVEFSLDALGVIRHNATRQVGSVLGTAAYLDVELKGSARVLATARLGDTVVGTTVPSWVRSTMELEAAATDSPNHSVNVVRPTGTTAPSMGSDRCSSLCA